MKLSVTGECGRLALLWAFRRRLFPAALLRDCTNAMDSVDMEPVGILAGGFEGETSRGRKRSRSEPLQMHAAEDGSWLENDGSDGEPMVKMKKRHFENMKVMLLDCTMAMQKITDATMESGRIIEDRVNKLGKISEHLQALADAMD